MDPETPSADKSPNQDAAAKPTASDASAVKQRRPSGKRKLILIALAVVLILAIAAGVVVATHGGKKPAQQAHTSSAAKQKDQPVTTTVNGVTKTELNKSVTTDYGYKITVNETVVGYKTAKPDPKYDPYLVKLTVAQVTQPQYSGTTPSPVNCVLIVNGQEIGLLQYSSGATSYSIQKDGYPAYDPFKAVTAGHPSSGYVVFSIPAGTKPTTLRYKQPAVKTPGKNGKTLPGRNYDLKF